MRKIVLPTLLFLSLFASGQVKRTRCDSLYRLQDSVVNLPFYKYAEKKLLNRTITDAEIVIMQSLLKMITTDECIECFFILKRKIDSLEAKSRAIITRKT